MPDGSSKLGWPHETVETVDADHLEMIKGKGVEDILDVLSKMEERVKQSITDTHDTAIVN